MLSNLGYIQLRCLLAGICALSAACSTIEVAGEIFDTALAFGKQRAEQASFLGTSTAIFYPNGVPDDVRLLPRLSHEQIEAIQEGLNVQAELLLGTIRKERVFLGSLVGREIADVADQRFAIEQLDASTLALSQSGVISIDSRVLQAIYRGVVLSSTKSLIRDCKSSDRSECERLALALVIAAREHFLGRSPITSLNKVKDLVGIVQARPGNMGELLDAAMRRLEENLATAGAEALSIEVSSRYDDALIFIVAHELGHRLLDHYGRAGKGERRFDLEIEADRFAALAVALTRNRVVWPRNPVLKKVDGELYEITPVGACPAKYNQQPTGHLDYFEFGYPLSGFPEGSAAYPSRETRAAAVRAVTQAAMSAISLVQRQKGLCDGGEPANLQSFLDENHAYRVGRLEEWKKHAKSKDADREREWIERVILTFEDLVNERAIGDKIYLEYMRRI